jgi:choline dehydrogenase
MRLATDARDRARLRSVVEVATDVLGQPSFTKLRTSEPSGIDGTPLSLLRRATHAEIDAWIDAVVDGSAHASATCSLGSVVDGECRVLGVDSLRVVDLSIVPSVPRANTNLTAIMIGERVASLMRGDR